MSEKETGANVIVHPAPGAPKQPKSLSLQLAGAQAEEFLELRAWATRSGWRSDVVHRVGKRASRGATQDHPTAEAARTTVEQLAAKAEKDGWTRRQARGGFARKADEFDAKNLPRPG